MIHFIEHFIGYVIIYPCWDLGKIHEIEYGSYIFQGPVSYRIILKSRPGWRDLAPWVTMSGEMAVIWGSGFPDRD